MSRIGKQPIVVPEKVQVSLDGRNITVKGPKGELSWEHHQGVTVAQENGEVKVAPVTMSKMDRSLWGLTRTLISNMVIGVTEGFKKGLEFKGVGYKAAVSGNKMTLNFGYSHPIEYELPEGVSAKVDKTSIEISGINKELVGFTAAKIRSFRPPEPYKGKGVRYSDEVIIRKAGKTGAK